MRHAERIEGAADRPRGWRTTARRYVQFCVVGGGGMAVDMGVLFFLADPAALGWDLEVAKVVAAEIALIHNFIWNELWTFRELTVAGTDFRHRLGRFLKFNTICAAGIALSVVLLKAQVDGIGLNVYLANFIAIVVVSVWNFLLNLRFGWRSTRESAT